MRRFHGMRSRVRHHFLIRSSPIQSFFHELQAHTRFKIMAALAQGLPVFFVPEQLLVAPMRDDVIYNRRRGDDACFQTRCAQRISPQVPVAGNTPFAIIAALCSTSTHPVSAIFTVLAAVYAAVTEIRTARIAAGAFGCSWHVPPQMKSSPRSSHAEPP